MRFALVLAGVLATILSVMALGSTFIQGTDIQLIAAGVFGTMSAVCFGFAAILAKMETPRKETATDLARELLEKWSSMEEATSRRLARDLIVKMNPASEVEVDVLTSVELKNLLSKLIRG